MPPRRAVRSAPFGPPPAWLADAVFYQIYPQSFSDSNGDGIGDLPGLIERLDYLRALGVNALWLNPIFPSPFGDAGYDVTDFCEVAPRYGTLVDAKRLFRAAHDRGIRIVLDLVAGHTSTEHPWFRASASGEPGPHRDTYIWTDPVWDSFGLPDFVRGDTPRDGAYLSNFFRFQPALNYGYAQPDAAKSWQHSVDAPGPRAVRRELKRIMQFWLELGCDGFRVDMAASLVKEDRTGSGLRSLWAEFRRWLDREWPEAVLVSEWSWPRRAIGVGFHIDFLIHFNSPCYTHLCAASPNAERQDARKRGWFDAEGRGDLAAFLRAYFVEYRATRGRGYLALPTGNHDFARFIYRRSERELRVFFAFLLTLPGVPFLYYGDEIGLAFRPGLSSKEGGYGRTGARTPMQWDATRNRGFSTARAEQLYLPVDDEPGRDVASQLADPASLLHLVRTLLSLRRTTPALGNASPIRPLHVDARSRLFVFERGAGRERVVVAINPTKFATGCRLRGAAGLQSLAGAGRTGTASLRLAPFSFGIWRRPAR
jgi:maltose alpha-D-glucosyltransferase/alpha-amylase